MKSFRINKIEEIIAASGAPSYTSSQIFDALFKKGVKSFSDITNISKELRKDLTDKLGNILSLKQVVVSQGDYANKYLLETRDGERIECVRLSYKNHDALCLSTQVGCGMGCKFCATGKLGLKRNLSADEIVDQWLFFKQQQIPVNSITVMGMGEPFVNPDFFDALSIFLDKRYFGIGARNISVSTVGVVPGIKKMSSDYPQVNLAFSLHSPFEEERTSLMPVNSTYSISEVFNALDVHLKKNKRKIFIVYLLLHEVNDSKEHAEALSKLINERGENSYLYHVNLMKFHPAPTLMDFQETSEKSLKQFEIVLMRNGINYTVRQDFGLGIDAACGQLRAKRI